MGSKFVTAPTVITEVEGTLAQYGITADISEIGMAMMIGMVALGVARTVLSSS